jgi:hypothetical protein
MSADEPSEASSPAGGGDEAPEGVFGNLPHTRPGVRSPRRDRADGPPSKVTQGDAESRHESAAAEAPAPPPRASSSPDEAPAEPEGGGLEDIAWAGVAAAAEAATIGVRLANRALEAMRDAVDRR